jgi:hypothetical protein
LGFILAEAPPWTLELQLQQFWRLEGNLLCCYVCLGAAAAANEVAVAWQHERGKVSALRQRILFILKALVLQLAF